MTKNIFLTGATGYLGRNLLSLINKNDYNIFLFVRESSDLSKIQTFINDVTLVRSANELPKIDIFIHMATVYGRKNESKAEILFSNKDWPLSLLEILAHPNMTFINTDTSLPRDFNDYSKSKKSFIEEVVRVHPSLRIINMVCEQFYGPNDGSFVSFIAKELEAGNDIELTEGFQRRDFIYIDDVLNAYLLILSKLTSLNHGFHQFPVGSGHTVSIRDVTTQICEILDCSPDHLKWGAKPMRKGEPIELKADNSLIKKLGWVSQYTVAQGLKLALKKEKT